MEDRILSQVSLPNRPHSATRQPADASCQLPKPAAASAARTKVGRIITTTRKGAITKRLCPISTRHVCCVPKSAPTNPRHRRRAHSPSKTRQKTRTQLQHSLSASVNGPPHAPVMVCTCGVDFVPCTFLRMCAPAVCLLCVCVCCLRGYAPVVLFCFMGWACVSQDRWRRAAKEERRRHLHPSPRSVVTRSRHTGQGVNE